MRGVAARRPGRCCRSGAFTCPGTLTIRCVDDDAQHYINRGRECFSVRRDATSGCRFRRARARARVAGAACVRASLQQPEKPQPPSLAPFGLRHNTLTSMASTALAACAGVRNLQHIFFGGGGRRRRLSGGGGVAAPLLSGITRHVLTHQYSTHTHNNTL